MTRAAACALVALLALAGAACASGSKGAPATPSPRVLGATARADTPTTSPLQQEGLLRWGFHPGRETGQRDAPVQYSALPPGYRIETYATGLDRPTALGFLPDGTLLVAEQGGTVRVIHDGALEPEPFFVTEAYFPRSEDQIIELGLVGLAADPAFAQNRLVYLYYATDEPERRTVLARVRDEGGRGTGLEEIFSLDAAPACCHIAGSLRFAPDGTLFVSVGDHQMETSAQDRSSPFGAILRIDRDGNPPADNPFVNDPAADARIFAYGLRNPFDIAIDPATGRVFATENGFIGQDAIIEVRPGANYGWPGFELSVPLAFVAPPLLFYHEAIGPAGTEFYSARALPVLTGSLLFCQFHRGGALHAVSFDLDGSVALDTVIALGCTSDVTTGPDGFVYFLDYVGGTVYRIARDV